MRRERTSLLFSPNKGKVTDASASDAMACGWYCEGPAGKQVRAGRVEGDGVTASLARRCAQNVTLGYAHGVGVSTGHHPHGHCGEGEGKAAATAVATAAVVTAASTARTDTTSPGFEESGEQTGFPQRAGGQCSVNNPSRAVRRGEAASVAVVAEAAAPASNRNRPKPHETPPTLARRWPTAGAPSSRGDNISGRGGRSARGKNHGGGVSEVELQRTGRRSRRGNRKKKKGEHNRRHQHQHSRHLDDHHPNHHYENPHHFHHHHHQHRGHEHGIHGVQGETSWTGRVSAAPPQHQQQLNQLQYQYRHHQHHYYRGYERVFYGVQGEAGWTGGVNAASQLVHADCAPTVMGSRPTPGGYAAWTGGRGGPRRSQLI